MQFLSRALIDSEYADALRRDLQQATVCRFLIAYIFQPGLDVLGQDSLLRVLNHERSFGVASMTCSGGYEPLLGLQSKLSGVRLKYFMDPLVEKIDEPRYITLLHSKLVYLFLEPERKSVVYIGSHNWSRPALGPAGPRNAEAAIRFEVDFSPGDLDGLGSSIASSVNRHLLNAWNLPLCLPATEENRGTFKEWYEKGCRPATAAPLEESIVILAVRAGGGEKPSGNRWQALKGRGVYMQALEEQEGHLVWRSVGRVLLLVWESEAALVSGRQPMVLTCRVTTNNAGPDSAEKGTNQSDVPISGFGAVIWDQVQLAASKKAVQTKRPAVTIWSGRKVNVFDFDFPTVRSNSAQVDDGVRPRYQFHLEVEAVAFPSDGPRPGDASLVWEAETFAVAASRESAKVQQPPGYHVEPRVEREMMECLTDLLKVDPERARVLPFSGAVDSRIGKRVSDHPLHETFIGSKRMDRQEEFYSKSTRGDLVPEMDARVFEVSAGGSIRRVQKVFTTPLERLISKWAEASRRVAGPPSA